MIEKKLKEIRRLIGENVIISIVVTDKNCFIYYVENYRYRYQDLDHDNEDQEEIITAFPKKKKTIIKKLSYIG